MLMEEREIKILEYLKQHEAASIKELKDFVFVSEATLRRDLTKMEHKGLIQRTHGGAVLPDPSTTEASLVIREQKQVREKRLMAQACLPYIYRGASIFIDSSSSVGHLLLLLRSINELTLITNGLNNALVASSSLTANVYLTSGIIFPKTNSVLGSDTVEYVKNFNCDLFIFSCSGLSLHNGIMEASVEQRQIKRQMLKQSRKHILLADHTKFDQIYMTKTCEFHDIDVLITDRTPSNDYVSLFKKYSVKLIIA